MSRTVMGCLAAAVFLLSCADGTPPPDEMPEAPAASPDDPWLVETAAELGEKLGGVAIGELDPDAPGQEIVAVGESGSVTLVRYGADGWSHELLADLPGEMIQVTTAELNGRMGDEVVAVGMAQGGEDDGGEGQAYVLSRAPDGTWSSAPLHTSSALIHAVCAVDLDGDLRDEIALAGFSQELVVMGRDDDGWSVVGRAPLGAAAKCAVPHDGGVALALTDGTVVHARPGDDGTWSTEVLDRSGAGRARLGSDGERLVAASDDGEFALLDGGSRIKLHSSGQKLRGAVLANLVPVASGLEAATAGYDGRVVVVTFDRDLRATARIVHEEGERLHHLAASTLESRGVGTWLATVGFSGRVVVLRGPGWEDR